jgi:hypothetical protein
VPEGKSGRCVKTGSRKNGKCKTINADAEAVIKKIDSLEEILLNTKDAAKNIEQISIIRNAVSLGKIKTKDADMMVNMMNDILVAAVTIRQMPFAKIVGKPLMALQTAAIIIKQLPPPTTVSGKWLFNALQAAASVVMTAFKQLPPPYAINFITSMSPIDAKIIIEEMPALNAAAIIENLPPPKAAAIVEHLSPSKAAAIVEHLSSPKAAPIVEHLSPPKAAAISKTLSAVTHFSAEQDGFNIETIRADNLIKMKKQMLYNQQRLKRILAKRSNSPIVDVSPDEPDQWTVEQNLFRDNVKNLRAEPVLRNNERRIRRQLNENKRNGKFSSKSYDVSPDVPVLKIKKNGIFYDEWIDNPDHIAKNKEKQLKRNNKTSKYYHAAKKQCLKYFPNYKTDQKEQYQKCIPAYIKSKSPDIYW